MDPVASTNLFIDALLRQQNWTSVEPWRVAQDVQGSAFTGVPGPSNGYSPVYGCNYLAQAGKAAHISAASRSTAPSLTAAVTRATGQPDLLARMDSGSDIASLRLHLL